MTKYYDKEIALLSEVYNAALTKDISKLKRFIKSISSEPLTTIGSGGSLSSASFAAMLHEYYSGQVSRALTPLDLMGFASDKGSIFCLSASGNNKDICAAYKAACYAEVGEVGALVLSDESTLHNLNKNFNFSNVMSFVDDSFKDGFLAVASLFASCILLSRAYSDVFGRVIEWPDNLGIFQKQILPNNFSTMLSHLTQNSFSDDTYSLLYSPSTKSAAIDLESRFVEASLGNLHIADLRNFGHGRHNWIAKRGERTKVICIHGYEYQKLSERTLSLLPVSVEKCSISLKGSVPFQGIGGLLIGLYFSRYVGNVMKIDPGKPGVPEFGRKLYRLGPLMPRVSQKTINRAIMLKRKFQVKKYTGTVQSPRNVRYLEAAVSKITEINIGGIVFDYDGTLCDKRKRYDPLEEDIVNSLNELANTGTIIGIATGRGPSAGVALRKVFPCKIWRNIIIGYYNGAIVTNLSDDRDPIAVQREDDPLIDGLNSLEIFKNANIRNNEFQTTIHLDVDADLELAIHFAKSLAETSGEQVNIVSSGHSIDLLRNRQSKLAVVSEVISSLKNKDSKVITIGDKGKYPGNDFELLDHAYGLSVDTVSNDSYKCWNLAPAGIKGTQATLYYLSKLKSSSDGTVKLCFLPSDKGYKNAT